MVYNSDSTTQKLFTLS